MPWTIAVCLLIAAPPAAPPSSADPPRNAVRAWESADAASQTRLQQIGGCERDAKSPWVQRRFKTYLETKIGTHVLAAAVFEDEDAQKQQRDIPPSPGVCVGIDGTIVTPTRDSGRTASFLPGLLALAPTTANEIGDFLEAVVMAERVATHPLVTPDEIRALAAREPIAAKVLATSEVGLAPDGRTLRGWYVFSCQGFCAPRFGLVRFEVTLSEDHRQVTFGAGRAFASDPLKGTWEPFPQ